MGSDDNDSNDIVSNDLSCCGQSVETTKDGLAKVSYPVHGDCTFPVQKMSLDIPITEELLNDSQISTLSNSAINDMARQIVREFLESDEHECDDTCWEEGCTEEYYIEPDYPPEELVHYYYRWPRNLHGIMRNENLLHPDCLDCMATPVPESLWKNPEVFIQDEVVDDTIINDNVLDNIKSVSDAIRETEIADGDIYATAIVRRPGLFEKLFGWAFGTTTKYEYRSKK